MLRPCFLALSALALSTNTAAADRLVEKPRATATVRVDRQRKEIVLEKRAMLVIYNPIPRRIEKKFRVDLHHAGLRDRAWVQIRELDIALDRHAFTWGIFTAGPLQKESDR